MQTIDEFARAKRNEYNRRWREKHREQYNAHQRKRNAENKSKRAAYTKRWREANRERYNAYHREYYAKKKNEAQKQALDIAQRDIEFVDLMPDVPVQRWIPETERLPKDGMVVLIAFRWGAIDTGWYCSDEWRSDYATHEDGEVTHWMPLPEPPKENVE